MIADDQPPCPCICHTSGVTTVLSARCCDRIAHDEIVTAAAVALADVMRLPEWAQVPALGHDMTPLAQIAVDAVRPLIEARLRERLAAAIHRDYEAAVEAGHSEEFLRVYLAANTEAMRIVRERP